MAVSVPAFAASCVTNGPGGGGGKPAVSAHAFALSNTRAAEAATLATAVANCFLLNVFMLVFLPD
jgi:hypothetical protein